MIAILDNLRSAHNVGSIIRTSDSFGIKEVYLCGITPDETNPKVKKTSLSAEDTIEFVHFKTTKEAVNHATKQGYEVYCLEIDKSAVQIDKIKPNNKIALVVGNEVSGVDPDIIKASKGCIAIPMRGKKESLNVSVAYGVAAYVLTNILDN